jgi:flagellar biosynthesis protein FliQ
MAQCLASAHDRPMIQTSVPRAIVAFAVSLGAGVFAASTQCSETEGMDGGWSRAALLIIVAVAVATVMSHHWWLLWVAVALTPASISLVDCVVHDPTHDGLEIFWYPIEAILAALVVVIAFAINRACSALSSHTLSPGDD